MIALVVAPAGASKAAPPVATVGSIGLRLLDVPVAAGNDPRAQIYIVDHLALGAITHRRIEVSNTTDSTAHVALYVAAATIEDGSFLGAAGHTQNDLSSWTSVYPESVDVAAGDREGALVSINVPIDAANGEQYGVVWAEVRSEPDPSAGVVQVNRVGIRLYVSVGPDMPAADFTIDSLTATRSPEGQPIVLATVHNTGGRALDMSGTLRLTDGPAGLSAGPFPANLGVTLAIGDTEPVTILLDGQLPAGPWEAHIALHSGSLERTARATITFPAAGVSPAVATSSSRPGWPYSAAAALLLLALLALLVVVTRGARGRRGHLRGPSGQRKGASQWG
jgi:hypothetical protein